MAGDRIRSYAHDGWVFDVVDEGPVDGQPVVLLHGFPQRATSWRKVTPLLHRAGLRTFAPDQRGYSPGARPRRRRDYATTAMVGDAVALVEEIGQPVHLVGHDWGAAVGWLAAAQRPDLVRTWTAVSVPHPAAMAWAVRHSDQWRRSWYMALFQLPWLPERLLTTRRVEEMLRAGGMDAEAVGRFREEIVADGALSGGLNWYRGLPFANPRASGGRVGVPTTLVWSDRDVALGRAGAERSSEFVTGPYSLVVLEGVSHWIPEEAPEALADAILARVSGTAG
jgi:pimeloyl-ACP methyl ester carboxylesterase